MPNKLGTVVSSNDGKHRFIEISAPCPACGTEAGRIINLPLSMKDVPDGFLIYVDDKGQLQVMEEDPHDYR